MCMPWTWCWFNGWKKRKVKKRESCVLWPWKEADKTSQGLGESLAVRPHYYLPAEHLTVHRPSILDVGDLLLRCCALLPFSLLPGASTSSTMSILIHRKETDGRCCLWPSTEVGNAIPMPGSGADLNLCQGWAKQNLSFISVLYPKSLWSLSLNPPQTAARAKRQPQPFLMDSGINEECFYVTHPALLSPTCFLPKSTKEQTQ